MPVFVFFASVLFSRVVAYLYFWTCFVTHKLPILPKMLLFGKIGGIKSVCYDIRYK